TSWAIVARSACSCGALLSHLLEVGAQDGLEELLPVPDLQGGSVEFEVVRVVDAPRRHPPPLLGREVAITVSRDEALGCPLLWARRHYCAWTSPRPSTRRAAPSTSPIRSPATDHSISCSSPATSRTSRSSGGWRGWRRRSNAFRPSPG